MHEHDHRTKTLINLSMYIIHMNSYTSSFYKPHKIHHAHNMPIRHKYGVLYASVCKNENQNTHKYIHIYIYANTYTQKTQKHVYIYKYIYIHIYTLRVWLHASYLFFHFVLPKILKNCCVTSGDEKLQNAKPREPRGVPTMASVKGFGSLNCWVLNRSDLVEKPAPSKLGMPCLNPKKGMVNFDTL